MKYRVRVSAISEDGETIDLGVVSVNAADEEDACGKAIEERWDERLRSASCKVNAQVLEEGEG